MASNNSGALVARYNSYTCRRHHKSNRQQLVAHKLYMLRCFAMQTRTVALHKFVQGLAHYNHLRCLEITYFTSLRKNVFPVVHGQSPGSECVSTVSTGEQGLPQVETIL